MDKQALNVFTERNHSIRFHLKKCRSIISNMIDQNNENDIINNEILETLEKSIHNVLMVNADSRDAIKVERVRNGFLDISSICGSKDADTNHKWNSSIDINENTTFDDIENQFNTKVLNKYKIGVANDSR